MKADFQTQLAKKLAVVTSLVGVSLCFSVPAISQVEPTPTATPDATVTPVPDTTITPVPETTTPTPETTTQPAPDTTTPAPGTTITPAPGDTMQTPAPTQPDAAPGATTGNIVQVASTSGSFNTLAQAVEEAGLADTLASGSYTVLAPTDQAFNDSLPPGAVEFLLQPENRDLLRQVLTYHVIPGEVTAKEFKTGSVKTLGGGVAVRVTPDRVIVNNASVVEPNISATNGVIHAVNRVLLPQQLRRTIVSRLETQEQNQPMLQQNQQNNQMIRQNQTP